METKLQVNMKHNYVDWNDIVKVVFYAENHEKHRNVAKGLLALMRSQPIDTGHGAWRQIFVSVGMDPDQMKDRNIFYYTLSKLISAGLVEKHIVEKDHFRYMLSLSFSERLQGLAALWLSYKKNEV